jgi:hypothetical protein
MKQTTFGSLGSNLLRDLCYFELDLVLILKLMIEDDVLNNGSFHGSIPYEEKAGGQLFQFATGRTAYPTCWCQIMPKKQRNLAAPSSMKYKMNTFKLETLKCQFT